MDISKELKIKIVNDLIEPHYFDEIQATLRSINYWQTTETVFEVISKLLVCFGGVLSFASGYFSVFSLSFVSGSVSTISLATFQYALYCSKRRKNNVIGLNEILKKLNIAPIVEQKYTLEDSSMNVKETSVKVQSPKKTEKSNEPNINAINILDNV